MTVILFIHGMSGYLGLQAWSTIMYQRLHSTCSTINLVPFGLTVKLDTRTQLNIHLGAEPKGETNVVIGYV